LYFLYSKDPELEWWNKSRYWFLIKLDCPRLECRNFIAVIVAKNFGVTPFKPKRLDYQLIPCRSPGDLIFLPYLTNKNYQQAPGCFVHDIEINFFNKHYLLKIRYKYLYDG
jgi:hypothetical protein